MKILDPEELFDELDETEEEDIQIIPVDRKEDKIPHLILKELFVGILVFGLLCEFIGVWFVADKMGYCLGVLIGVILAAGMAAHMSWSLEKSLDLVQGEAEKQIRKYSVIRYFVIVVVFAVVMVTHLANPLAAFLGIMSLKVAAYLQPFTHKCYKKIYKDEEEPS